MAAGATWGRIYAWLRVAALATVGLSAVACSAGVDGGETTASTEEATTTYDGVAKPIPSAYLFKKTNGNMCCSGANATATSCTTACADSKGLITSAGVTKSADYYQATGQGSLTTFDSWKNYYGFPKRLPGESQDAYRKRANVVVYYNRTELGLGRELGCVNGSNGIACYVSNYGDHFDSMADWRNPDQEPDDGSHGGLHDAMYGAYGDGLKRKNTVVISYQPAREYGADDGSAVQFAAFGPDGSRLDKAQLDTMGARPIPQICMSCHGGVWDADSRAKNGTGSVNGIARYARFLPMITSTVTFSNWSPYTLAEQEEAIRAVNEFAWKARGNYNANATPTTGGSLSYRQTLLMGWLYTTTAGSTPMQGTLTWRPETPGRQYAEYAWPGGWSAQQQAYNNIALPYCDTCHMAMETVPASGNRPAQAGTTYNWLKSLADMQTNNALLGAFMGANSSGFSSRSNMMMPHAQNAFARFWGDNTFDGNCSYGGSSLPAADCFLKLIGTWPSGRPAAAQFTATNQLRSFYPANSYQGEQECGQGSVSSSSSTTGTDSGRRLASVLLPGSGSDPYAYECVDGCKANQDYCPGAETAANSSASTRFPGVRQECRPFSQNGSYGTCFQCGRLYQQPCQQVGSTCRTDMNPNCNNLPACHEGTLIDGTCQDQLLTMTASQSSTYGGASASRAIDGNSDGNFNNGSVSHTNNANAWWRADFGTTKKVSWIQIYNRSDCCWDRLGNSVVEYSTNGTSWTTFPNGDFTGVTPTTSNVTIIVPPKSVDARYVRIRLLNNAMYLQLAEVMIWGW